MKPFLVIIQILLIVSISHSLTFQEYIQLEKHDPSQVLKDAAIDGQQEHFPGVNKLIFLTPWNKKGFQYSIKYAHKLDYVSPCWYTFKISKSGQPIFQNQHNFDQEYVDALRSTNNPPKIVPRVYLDARDFNFFKVIGGRLAMLYAAVSLIGNVVKEKQLDGIVWDTPYNLFEKDNHPLNVVIVEFLKALRAELGGEKIIMVNMANPTAAKRSELSLEHYNQLPIDWLLIQNYDASDDYLEMVRQSLKWSKGVESPIKIMLMLPFFAVKTNVGPLSAEEATKSLNRMGVASAEIAKGMCKFTENKSKRVFLIPCLSYFQQVLAMAEQVKVAVGFWEGGNGLENYFKFL